MAWVQAARRAPTLTVDDVQDVLPGPDRPLQGAALRARRRRVPDDRHRQGPEVHHARGLDRAARPPAGRRRHHRVKPADIDARLAAPLDRREGRPHGGARHVDHRGHPQRRHPRRHGHGRARTAPAARPCSARAGSPPRASRAAPRSAPRGTPRWSSEVGAVLGAGGAHEGRPGAARPDDQHPPLAARRAQLRVLLRGPAAVGPDRGRRSSAACRREGVAATAKHLVGNEAEFERTTMSSDIDERALRELYLVPFELAVREGGALGVMTCYNRLNGELVRRGPAGCSPRSLRGEWGFDGHRHDRLVRRSPTPVPARAAGLDLQMPGPDRVSTGRRWPSAVAAGDVPRRCSTRSVRRLAQACSTGSARGDDAGRRGPAVDRPEHRALARRGRRRRHVLLRNDGVLPARPRPRSTGRAGRARTRTGPHIMGGGSAQLTPALPGVAARGARRAPRRPAGRARARLRHRQRRSPRAPLARTPDGEPVDGRVLRRARLDGRAGRAAAARDLRLLSFGPPAAGRDGDAFSFRARRTFAARRTGEHTFTLVQAGRARLLGRRRGRHRRHRHAAAGRAASFFGLRAARRSRASSTSRGGRAGRGGRRVHVARRRRSSTASRSAYRARRARRPARRAAVAAAAAADVAVVVVGTSDEWESRGPRPRVDGPARRAGRAGRARVRGQPAHGRRRQRRRAGRPWTGPTRPPPSCSAGSAARRWRPRWTTVLIGEAEPGGPAADTMPLRLEHNPSYGNFPGENDHVPLRRGAARRVPLVRHAATCRCASRSATAARTRRSRGGRHAVDRGARGRGRGCA